MKKAFNLVILSLGMLCVGNSMVADVITYTNAIMPGSPPFAEIIVLPAFDQAYGTLNEVTVTLSASGYMDFELDYPSYFISYVSGFVVGNISVSGTSIGPSAVLIQGQDSYIGSGQYRLDIAGYESFSTINGDDLAAFSSVAPEVLIDWGQDYIDGEYLSAYYGSYISSGEVRLSYDFTPVPEPGLTLMTGLACWPLLYHRGKRRA